MGWRFARVSALVLAMTLAYADAAVPVQVRILDGESAAAYQPWQLTAPLLKRVVDETGPQRSNPPSRISSGTAMDPGYAKGQNPLEAGSP
jgi:hypothetical protein